MIRNILLDLDDTIFDFHKAESIALSKALVDFGIEPTREICARYSEINISQWKRLELGEITRNEVHINRFKILMSELGVSIQPESIARVYKEYLSCGHYYMEDALESIQELAKHYRLYIVSNGTYSVQKGRLDSANIYPLFQGIFISEQIGYEKPSPFFFKECFAKIPDFRKEETIIVGDSLTSDIKGGILSGLRTVWLHRPNAKRDLQIKPDYSVVSWKAFMALLSEINLYSDILCFEPINEQEERDKELILHSLETEKDIFDRSNRLAHITASGWVYNKEHTKVLMAYHNIYQSWSWLGGHADGDRNLLETAIREVREESGIQNVTPITEGIFSLESLTVDGHEKNGEYVSAHLHLNITYLLEADENEAVCAALDENSAVAWFSPEKAIAASTEPWFQKRVYRKLVEKMHKINGKAID